MAFSHTINWYVWSRIVISSYLLVPCKESENREKKMGEKGKLKVAEDDLHSFVGDLVVDEGRKSRKHGKKCSGCENVESFI